MNTARFLKYVWPFYNIMDERVQSLIGIIFFQKIREHKEFFIDTLFKKKTRNVDVVTISMICSTLASL